MTNPPDESKCIRREPNYSLLLPILYAPVFPILRIALKNNPKLPVAYGGTDASVSPEELALKQFVLDHCTPKRGDSAASLASLDAAGDSSGSLADLAGP